MTDPGPLQSLIDGALEGAGPSAPLVVATPAHLPLDEALTAIDALRERVKAQTGPVVLLSDLAVLKGRSGTLFELPIKERPFPRARRGETLDLTAELALANERIQAGLLRTEHAHRQSARRLAAREQLDAVREPRAAGDARATELAASEREESLTETRRELAERLGLSEPRAYVSLLCEHALSDRCHVVRLSQVQIPALLGEAARAGLLDVDDELTVDLLPRPLALTALKSILSALSEGREVPRAIHLSTADRSPLLGRRLKDLLDLHRGQSLLGGKLKRAARELRGHTPKTALLCWSDEERVRARNIERLGVKLEVEWRDTLLRRWLPDAEDAWRDLNRPVPDAPRAAYAHLAELLDDATERYAGRTAFSFLDGDGQQDLTYRELGARARAVCSRLAAAGVEPGDRVVLCGDNHPSWPVAAFGIFLRGAVLMPVDKELEPEQLSVLLKKGRPALALLDKAASARFSETLSTCPEGALALFTQSGPHEVADLYTAAPEDLASVLFTSGTTGEPKGVMLSHANFTALLAGLSRCFEMGADERLLSVLPLHHTFEFSCGLLLPLIAGGQVFYLDELSGERVLYALGKSRATSMVGVPALWQLLGRRVEAQVKERGPLVEKGFNALLGLNRRLNEQLGLDLGRTLFRPVHKELGGELRTLISGGAALPGDVHALFRGLGLPLAEGYGLTEAAPVLTVASAETTEAGTVGNPIPGVEIKIEDPDESGAGAVLARGGNVMLGYFEDDAATRLSLTDDGWLRTGDLGRIDAGGALRLVGRAKDVVVTSSGENIYLDDAEALLGRHLPSEAEFTLIGVSDPRGGERLALVTASLLDTEHAIKKLPPFSRPSVVRVHGRALPRTATQKVKRKDVRAWLEALLKAEAPKGKAVASTEVKRVLDAIALVTGVSVKTLDPRTRLLDDLGFDSLMWVELAGALEKSAGKRPDPEALAATRDAQEVADLLGATSSAKPKEKKAASADARIKLPGLIKRPLRSLLGRAQSDLYRFAFPAEVIGRAHIPQNRAAIVVANHCSHLDTGLVKHALGKYGSRLRPLAAKDYFFEGNKLKVAFFEELTNLAPIDRESASGLAFEQARSLVERGEVVLIYPEGTRRKDGTLGEFKPLVGRLALATGAPVLPLHLEGTYEALPRDQMVPAPRALTARIGRALETADLMSELPTAAAQAREATRRIREAVRQLAPGSAAEDALARRSDDGGLAAAALGDAPRGVE